MNLNSFYSNEYKLTTGLRLNKLSYYTGLPILQLLQLSINCIELDDDGRCFFNNDSVFGVRYLVHEEVLNIIIAASNDSRRIFGDQVHYLFSKNTYIPFEEQDFLGLFEESNEDPDDYFYGDDFDNTFDYDPNYSGYMG
jgi:hypothetical protein